MLKEETTVLHDFGKHPGYRKKPMSHPENVEVAPNGARDWNDDSAKSEEPFGKQVGSSAPFDEKVVNILTDAVFDTLKKMNIVREAVDEKNFLRVPQEPTAAPMADPMAATPEAMADPNGVADAGMMPDDPMMQGAGPEGENPFDSNFDAGVEADEDTDPEKFIQQLTGKLTQSLRDYDEQSQGNTDLDKYVLGMVIKQCVKNLDDEGRKDLIKKIKETPEGEEVDIDGADAPAPEEPANAEAPDAADGETPAPMNEVRKIRMSKKQFMKLCESLNDETSARDRDDKKISAQAKSNNRTKPFMSPSFK